MTTIPYVTVKYATLEEYEKMPFEKWNQKTPVYCLKFNKYFFSVLDLEIFLNENKKANNGHSLRLVICDPVYPAEIDIDDLEYMLTEYIPSNCDLVDVASAELLEALDHLNEVISQEKPWSWLPGDIRTVYRKQPLKSNLTSEHPSPPLSEQIDYLDEE